MDTIINNNTIHIVTRVVIILLALHCIALQKMVLFLFHFFQIDIYIYLFIDDLSLPENKK
jgi:hypothetical protein